MEKDIIIITKEDKNLKIRIPTPKSEEYDDSENKIKSQKYSICKYLLCCMCFFKS
jgi:hypothetical protein